MPEVIAPSAAQRNCFKARVRDLPSCSRSMVCDLPHREDGLNSANGTGLVSLFLATERHLQPKLWSRMARPMKPTISCLCGFLLLLAGCGGAGRETSDPPIRLGTELAEDRLTGDPVRIRDTVVTHLEAPGSNTGFRDTGASGSDEWTVRIDAPATFTVGLSELSGVSLRFLDTQGSEIAIVRPGEQPLKISLTVGLYQVQVVNEGRATRMVRVGWQEDGFYASEATSPWPKAYANSQNTGLGGASSASGQQKWAFLNGQTFPAAPAIGADGTIYFGSTDNNLYAFNPDGTVKWKAPTQFEIEGSPAVGFDGTIYVGSDDNSFYAFSPNGAKKWSFTTGYFVRGSPAIGKDGTIYFGSMDQNLYALNPDGSKKWQFRTNGLIESSPAIGGDGTIYIGSDDDSLYAVNSNGSLKWSFGTMDNVIGAPSIGSDETVYVGSQDGNLYAVNPNGTQKWSIQLGSISGCPAIGPDGSIYVLTDENGLFAIDPSGVQNWTLEDPYGNSSPAVAADGTLFVGSDDSSLYAISPSGTVKWSFNATNYVSSPAIGADGTLYFGTALTIGANQHSVFALK